MLSRSIAPITNLLRFQTTLRSFHGAASLMSYPKSKNGKPLGPYLRFCKENRPRVVSENSELKSTEVVVELGKLWRALPESERKRYTDEYNEAAKKSA